MYLEPVGKQIAGRIVDVVATKGGLELSSSRVQNVSVFVWIDRVGPEVDPKYTPGLIICHKQLSTVWLRDGTQFVVVEEKDVIAIVREIDLNGWTVGGKKFDKMAEVISG
jgi:hypothetical protein